MKLNIKLGEKHPEYPCCVSETSDKERVWYPEVRVTRDEPLDLPKEGTMTIRYKKIESSERGEKYSCTFEVHEIISAQGEADESPSKRDRSSDDALDRLAAAIKKEKGGY